MLSEINNIFRPFEGIHSGEAAVLFATGPSVGNYVSILEETINFGVNKIVVRPEIELDYYFFGDRPLKGDKYNYVEFIKYSHVKKQRFSHVLQDGVSLETQIPSNICRALGAIGYEMTIEPIFKRDIAVYCLFNHSIVFAALQFILYTGIRKVYLVGCDVSPIRSFTGREIDPSPYHGLIEYWKTFKNFVGQEYSNVEIISVNPVNLKGLFRDIVQKEE